MVGHKVTYIQEKYLFCNSTKITVHIKTALLITTLFKYTSFRRMTSRSMPGSKRALPGCGVNRSSNVSGIDIFQIQNRKTKLYI